MNDLAKRVDAVMHTVEQARGLPMSASCVVNRVELLAALDDVRATAVHALEEATEVIASREAVLDDARVEAAEMVAEATRRCRQLATESSLVRDAEAEAASIVADAHEASATVRAEIDAYVDSKLATFEAVLSRTLTSVGRGRARLVVPTSDDLPATSDGAASSPVGPRSVRVLRRGNAASAGDHRASSGAPGGPEIPAKAGPGRVNA